MRNSCRSAAALAAAVAGALCLVAVPIAGQAPAKPGARATTGKYTPPRTAGGQPDLQGVWANNSVTPLERPDFFKGRTTMTDQELATLKQNAAELFAQRQAGDLLGDRLIQEILKDPNLRPFDPNTGNYNSFWVVDRDWDNRTSLIVDPPDGKIPPLTEQARSRRGRGGQASEFPEGPEQVSNSVRCISYGVPNLLAGYNSYFQIVQGKGYVAIMQEMIHDVRIVPLDGRPHVDKSVRLWNGDSRGHWDGETLVVDTTNYSRAGAIRGASEKLHLVERFTRVSADTIEYSLTFDDPTVWTKPWTAMLRLKSTPDKIYEYACHEGNHSIVGILAGARAKETKAASSTASK